MRLFIAAMFAFAAGAAQAEGTSLPYNNGGWFSRFDPVVEQYNRSGERFRIEGDCRSACTLFLSIRNVCVERSATLWFHAGHDRQRKLWAPATNHMLRAYNARLRKFVLDNGYMRTFDYHPISGKDIIEKFGYRECPRQ